MTIEEGSSSTMATTATTAVIEDETSQTLFGKYEVGRLLGCGAFAKVYHARDKRSGQSVAIKVVSKQKVFKGNLTGHVKREISIMSRLRHPHIVRLHEVLATKTKICFVMEFAKGGELFAKISKGRFSEDLSRKYFQQLISAVGYCHTHGIFHRDLKPENLLLDENWDLKVSDFGLSALTEQIRPDGLLHTLCGTPAYVAPEILAKKGYNGPQVDVWSCGIILFVLNAGYLPFNDPNLMVMYRKIYKGEFRCPRWTSPELKRLLTRLLDINPETRITIDEIHKDVWFQKGYKEIKPYFDHEFDYFKIGGDEGEVSKKYMNAFDIICSGLDISNLFRYKTNESAVVGERFLSAEAPEKIADTIEEVAKKEGVSVMKKKQGGTTRLRLEGQNGNFCGVVEINQLTEKLVMVEVRKKEAGGFWKDKFRPQLDCLIYRPDEQVAGE